MNRLHVTVLIMTNKSKQKRSSDEEIIEVCQKQSYKKLKTKIKSMCNHAIEDVRKSYEEEMASLCARNMMT